MLSPTEENYLKAIYYLQQDDDKNGAAVNDIAERVNTRPATVTDMLRKLSEKELIHYKKYKKTSLTAAGEKYALQIVRKHRLWEVFLHLKLNFPWDEVHDIAEQLEHVVSTKLIEKLDEYLGFPQFDPHGDPIPNAKGEMNPASNTTLAMVAENSKCCIVAVKDTSAPFLLHLARVGLKIGTCLQVVEVLPFDNSIIISFKDGQSFTVSECIAQNILVSC